jgi:hypothetical protein
MATIKDSGERRFFETGANRDMATGKGRCDLVPIKEMWMIIKDEFDKEGVLLAIDFFMKTGEVKYLIKAANLFVKHHTNMKAAEFMIETSKQYEGGALKYGERNWEKGIPLNSYIDSAIRHFLKHTSGWDDEPHDRAFMWNILAAMWTVENHKDMINIPFELLGKNLKKSDLDKDRK